MSLIKVGFEPEDLAALKALAKELGVGLATVVRIAAKEYARQKAGGAP